MSDDFAPFVRQQLIEWWNQQHLAQAHVLVLGAGALGNEVLKNLALVGIGNIYIVDFDIVEASNLSRSVLFRSRDATEQGYKAELAARRTAQLHPYEKARVAYFHGDLVWELGAGVYRTMDVVVGCLDNVEARRYVNLNCWKSSKVWIDGGIQNLWGTVSFYTAATDQACYECGVGDHLRKLANERYSCLSGVVRSRIHAGYEPTTQTTSAVIAAIQSQEAIKVCHGMDIPGGCRLYYHGLLHNFAVEDPSVTSVTNLARNPDCFCHQEDRFTNVVELDITNQHTVKEMLTLARQHLKMDHPELVFGTFHPSSQGRRFVVAADCATCGYHIEIQRPAHQVHHQDVICPHCAFTCPSCGHVSQNAPVCPECNIVERPEMRLQTIHRVSYTAAQSVFRLAQLGIPNLDIVKIVDGDGREQYVQIGQNLALVFQCIERT